MTGGRVLSFRYLSVGEAAGPLLHHKLLNDAAFDFLELLLKSAVNRKSFLPVHFKDLAEAEVY